LSFHDTRSCFYLVGIEGIQNLESDLLVGMLGGPDEEFADAVHGVRDEILSLRSMVYKSKEYNLISTRQGTM